MKYGFEKCVECGVTWRVCIDGQVQFQTPDCSAHDVCIECLEKYAKLGKAAKKAHEKHEKKTRDKKTDPVV